MTGNKPALFLGLDLGTTVVTAVVTDRSGAVLDRCSIPLSITHPGPGLVEQDPAELVAAIRHVAQALLDRHDGVVAAGLDNQGESFLLWDADTGAPLTRSVVWQDQRGAAACHAVRKELGEAEVRARSGLVLDSYFTGPKVHALLEGDAALRARAQRGTLRLSTTDAWVVSSLVEGAPHVTDVSTASRTLLFNLRTLQWDPVLCAAFHVAASMLPRVLPSAGPVGPLCVGRHRVPLTALVVDQQAALFAQGCHAAGQAKCTLGTGAFVLVNTGGTPLVDAAGVLATVAWQAEGSTSFALDGGVFTAGAAVQWLQDGLGILGSPAESEALARRARGDRVVVVPALAGLAAPHWLTHARGTILGITRATTREDVARGTLEGVAHRVADVVEAMEGAMGVPIRELRVDGGPSRNAFLCEVLADFTGRTVAVADEPEATARGSAMLAAVGAGHARVKDMGGVFMAGAVHRPRLDAQQRLEERTRWKRALDALRVFHGN